MYTWSYTINWMSLVVMLLRSVATINSRNRFILFIRLFKLGIKCKGKPGFVIECFKAPVIKKKIRNDGIIYKTLCIFGFFFSFFSRALFVHSKKLLFHYLSLFIFYFYKKEHVFYCPSTCLRRYLIISCINMATTWTKEIYAH